MTTTERPLLRIVVGSVRPVRVGDQIAQALAPLVAEATGARVEITDLVDLGLPFLDEPRMPALGDYQHAHTKAWSRLIADTDAVVFLTPQYNGGYPASLKNAIDFLYHEWKSKPALVVSYGGHGGGLSGAQLRGVLEFVGLDLVTDNVELTIPHDAYGADGRLTSASPIVAANAERITAAVRALATAGEASRAARAPVVAVVGATGQQGGAVVRSLLASGGWTVRAVVRDPGSDAARALADDGAELVRADLDEPDTLRAAFEGARGVYSVQSFTGPDGIDGEIRQGKAVADAAKDAGVAHLVYASIDGAERASGVPHFESKFAIEQHIESLGQPATILRLVAFMDNFGTYAMPSLVDGEIVIAWPPSADTRIQLVAAQDIGVVAAAVFADPDRFVGTTVTVAGDELSMTEMAQAFTNVTGMPARYEESDIEQVRSYSEDLAHMYEFFEHRGFQADLAEVRRLHPGARTLEDWIRETGWQPRAHAWG